MTLIDKLKLHPFVSENVSIDIHIDPFRHIIIDNLFKTEIYEKISKKFPELISRVPSYHGQVGLDPKHIYKAFIYGFKQDDCIDGFEFFAQEFLKNFLSELFKITFNQHIAYSGHFHKGSIENPSNNGWIHTDLNICSAINDPSKNIKIISDCVYADDSNDYINTNKIARSVASLFYLNNLENLSEDDGGGTGIYGSYSHQDFIKSVLPINNRLFAFEISPISYHAFIGAKFDRSAIVQWFHSNPSYYVHKHLDKFKKQFKEKNKIFELWKKDNLWSLEQDPEYLKYFDKSIIEVLSN